ncbi:ATP-dependent Clp protease proteolytic subunit [Bradyrhizobium sp. BR 1433]|uniref:ATP-dependent Clp protease proteolytic subunit n=1 Tax=Bradyrhizobium sp. BR 1433 TaxID=3447967 RepID=UPI003EE5EE45
MEFFSEPPSAVDYAKGKAQRRDVAAYLQSINDARDHSIVLKIDDAGGVADDALQIALAVLAHPWRVEAQIIGRCSSSAVLLALSADVRTIAPEGRVLVHAAVRCYGEQQFKAMQFLSAEERHAINESLCDTDDVTTSLLKSRLDVTEQTARAWIAENRIWNATEALTNGFVHSIAEFGA